jgi:hypothetical protein
MPNIQFQNLGIEDLATASDSERNAQFDNPNSNLSQDTGSLLQSMRQNREMKLQAQRTTPSQKEYEALVMRNEADKAAKFELEQEKINNDREALLLRQEELKAQKLEKALIEKQKFETLKGNYIDKNIVNPDDPIERSVWEYRFNKIYGQQNQIQNAPQTQESIQSAIQPVTQTSQNVDLSVKYPSKETSSFRKEQLRQEETTARNREMQGIKFGDQIVPHNELLMKFDELENGIGIKLNDYDPKKNDIPGFTIPVAGKRVITDSAAANINNMIVDILNGQIKVNSGAQTSAQEIDRNLKALALGGTFQDEKNLIDALKRLRKYTNEKLRIDVASFNPDVIKEYIKNGGKLIYEKPRPQKWIDEYYNEVNKEYNIAPPADMTEQEKAKFNSLSPEKKQAFLRRISNG